MLPEKSTPESAPNPGVSELLSFAPSDIRRASGREGPANSPSGLRHNFEHKTPASLLISVQERVRQIQRQTLRVVRSLDARYPGSTFEQELKSYGVDGALCVLVSGPFADLSKGFNHVADLHCARKSRGVA